MEDEKCHNLMSFYYKSSRKSDISYTKLTFIKVDPKFAEIFLSQIKIET